jgi:hypothetical protein
MVFGTSSRNTSTKPIHRYLSTKSNLWIRDSPVLFYSGALPRLTAGSRRSTATAWTTQAAISSSKVT